MSSHERVCFSRSDCNVITSMSTKYGGAEIYILGDADYIRSSLLTSKRADLDMYIDLASYRLAKYTLDQAQ